MATEESADKVDLEMGNSPKKLFSNYRELVTKTQANAWFDVTSAKVKKAMFVMKQKEMAKSPKP